MATNYGLVSRLLSAAVKTLDTNISKIRLNQYGEQASANLGQEYYAKEGSYFITTTPNPNTGVALTIAAQTGYIGTAPAILIKNTDSIGGKDISLKRITLICTAAGTGLSALDSMIVVDNINRWTSGGTAMTMKSSKADNPNASIAQVFNASTAIVSPSASSDVRFISRNRLRTGIPVIGDTFKLSFGAEPTTEFGLLSGAAAANYSHSAAPVVIPPQSTALFYIWGAGMTAAPQFEVIIETVER